MSTTYLDANTSGDIINILSTDLTRIEFSILNMPYLVIGMRCRFMLIKILSKIILKKKLKGPIQVLFVVGFILYKVDYTFLSGLMLLALILPFKMFVARILKKFM